MVKHAHRPIIGALWMILAGMCFAINNASIQYMSTKLGLHNTVIGFFQYFIAFIVMLPWMIKTGLTSALKTNRLSLHIIRVLMSVIGIQLWLWALAWPIPISQAIALLMTSPIFVTIGSALFLHERVGLARWFATVIAIIGSLIILEPWSESFNIASLLPVAAAFFWAIYSLMVRHLSDTESTGSMVVYLLIFIAPFNFFLAVPNFATPTPAAWYLLLISGSILALAQWSLARAYANADASFIQPFDLVKLPLNTLVAWLVFSYMPGGTFWLGSVMLVGATIFILHRENNTDG
ncbi:MAG TPA: DMT family transporter [Oceanospirillales bacterium]|nr:DMT family transporter [Oceanospirillales bacterium]